MKYLMSNPGKFHHFEVARELFKKNQLNKIICGYPWFKLKHEGVDKDKIISLSLITILTRFIKVRKITDFLNDYQSKKIDLEAGKFLDNSNVFIGLSTCGLKTGIEAKKRGIVYICERSSAHIKYQNEILKREYEKLKLSYQPIPKERIEREIDEYNESDFILVPSSFVKKTFENYGYSKAKVLKFGSNLSSFYPIKQIKKDDRAFEILFVGQISIQKGIHYLLEAFKKFKHPFKKLHIVGSKTQDNKYFFNKFIDKDIIIHGHMNHLNLNKLMNQCHVIVLPSIQDGFGLVVSQAAAAGCPSIVSENTGAADFVRDSKGGMVVKSGDSNLITEKFELFSEDKYLLETLASNALKFSQSNPWENYVLELNKLVIEYLNRN